MKCPKCDSKKKLKKEKVDYDYSKISGIPGCILKEVDQFTCPACKFKFQDFGLESEVVDAIVDILLGASPMPRAGVQYIRKHLFIESQFEFGKRVGINPTVIQEIEAQKRPLSEENSQKIQDSVIKYRATKISIGFEF